MQRLTYLACCTSLALGLASPTLAGPLGSAASDAFRRLPQSAPAPAPAANTSDPAPASPSTASPAPTAAPTSAPAAPTDLLPDPVSPLPGELGGTTTTGGATGGVVVRDDTPRRVPEPGVLALLGAGALGLMYARRRRR